MRRRIAVASLAAITFAILATAGYSDRVRAWITPATADSALSADEIELLRYQQTFYSFVAGNAGIEAGDSDYSIAVKLTNHLYSTTKFTGTYAHAQSVAHQYLNTITQQTMNYCSSLSTMLVWSLGLFDIPARSVALASEQFLSDPDGPTHVFVEAKIDGRFIVFDPTFNVVYGCGSETPISAKQAAECVTGQGDLTWTYTGPKRDGRTLEDYPVAIQTLLHSVDATDDPENFYSYERPHGGWLAETRKKFAVDLAPANAE